MQIKKANIKGSIVLAFLLIIIVIIVYNFIGPGSKDIKASKNFIAKLYSINAVNTDQDLNSIKYERIRNITGKNQLIHRTIVTQSFGIDLDKQNNVIGFAKKDISKNTNKLSEQEAKTLADSYLKNICDGDVVIKAIKDNESEEYLPYYSFIYTKEKYGYPFYFDEIKLNINKESGFLDGYSNSALQRKCKEPQINISMKEAENTALEFFRKYNKEGTVEGESPLVFSDNKMDKDSKTIAEVCYMISIKGKGDNNKQIEWKVFVSTENGDIINVLKDGAENEVTTS